MPYVCLPVTPRARNHGHPTPTLNGLIAEQCCRFVCHTEGSQSPTATPTLNQTIKNCTVVPGPNYPPGPRPSASSEALGASTYHYYIVCQVAGFVEIPAQALNVSLGSCTKRKMRCGSLELKIQNSKDCVCVCVCASLLLLCDTDTATIELKNARKTHTSMLS